MIAVFRIVLMILAGIVIIPMESSATILAPDTAQQTESAPSPPDIALESDNESDAAIKSRVKGIFSAIRGLENVTVSVSSGVVTLSGTVLGDDFSERAESVASRIAGVVTVENNLSRSLAVDDTVTPALSQFGDDARNIVKALPLIGAAIAIAALIIAIGYLLASFGRLWRRITPNAFLAEMVASLVRFAFILLGLIVALQILGATALLGAVLGGAGVIGIALGFAVRDTVDNYVSSLMLSLRQPFRANDHVLIEDQEGHVVRLTTRATILMTVDGNHLRIPNSTVFKAIILNYTTNPERRFEFNLGVDADDNALDAIKTGLAAVTALPFVLENPKAEAVIADVGDSNIILTFFGWLDQRETDFLKGRSLAIQTAMTALKEAEFTLPEPIYRLRFEQGGPLDNRHLGVTPQTDQSKSNKKTLPHKAAADAISSALEAAPNKHIELLVREERAMAEKEDLLDEKRPIE